MITLPNFILFILFGFGIFAQIWLLLKKQERIKALISIPPIVLLLVVSTIAYLKSQVNVNFPIYFFYTLSIFILVSILTTEIMNEILPHINEVNLIAIGVIFWYTYLKIFGLKSVTLIALFILLTLPTLFFAFSSKPPKFHWRVFLYVWFLFVMLFFMLAYFKYLKIFVDFSNETNTLNISNIYSTIIAGMTFFYIEIYVLSIIMLIPLPGKYESIKERIEKVKELISLLSHKYEEKQFSSLLLFFTAVAIILLLLINHMLKIVADGILISLIFILVNNLIATKTSSKVLS